jgi:hypothetical protein
MFAYKVNYRGSTEPTPDSYHQMASKRQFLLVYDHMSHIDNVEKLPCDKSSQCVSEDFELQPLDNMSQSVYAMPHHSSPPDTQIHRNNLHIKILDFNTERIMTLPVINK